MIIIEGLYDIVATVVAFRKNVNEPSSIISEDDFKLMGDLTEACFKIPGLVVVNSSVTHLDEERDCFSLTPTQYVTGATQLEALPLRAVMNRSTPFAPYGLKLPKVNALVSFTGRLLCFEANSEAGANSGSVSNKPVTTSEAIDDEDTIALKARIRKYTDHINVKDGKDMSKKNESSMENLKGKRKVTLTYESGGAKVE
ncbi:hypothetical protein V8E53_008101 [Lactarius tabidus]